MFEKLITSQELADFIVKKGKEAGCHPMPEDLAQQILLRVGVQEYGSLQDVQQNFCRRIRSALMERANQHLRPLQRAVEKPLLEFLQKLDSPFELDLSLEEARNRFWIFIQSFSEEESWSKAHMYDFEFEGDPDYGKHLLTWIEGTYGPLSNRSLSRFLVEDAYLLKYFPLKGDN